MEPEKTQFLQRVDTFRERLSHGDALPQLVSLGVISGTLAALIIVAFRWLFETPLQYLLGESEGFESLSMPMRFLLPALGAILRRERESLCAPAARSGAIPPGHGRPRTCPT